MHLLAQFITMFEVFVMMHGETSCAQILSTKLGSDDCLVVLLWRKFGTHFTGKRATDAFVLLLRTGDNLYRSSGFWTRFFQVVVHRHIH